MQMKYDVGTLRGLYREGRNIAEWVRAAEGRDTNSAAAIRYSYDLQAGSYTAALDDGRLAAHKRAVGGKLAAILDSYAPGSLLDAGIGEATTTVPLLASMQHAPAELLGLDLSLSRLLFARRNLSTHGYAATLFAADLDNIPLADNAVDVAVTVHAIEPNHGREEAILAELLRVTARALVMVEPSWEFGSPTARTRMASHGYVRDLPATLARLGYQAARVEKWGLDFNPENVAALIVAEKAAPRANGRFISPISRKPLVARTDCWFCPDDGHAFPIIAGIPCLAADNAVLASKLDAF